MADLRLDDIEAAFADAPESTLGSSEPGKSIPSLNVPLNQMPMFDTQPEISFPSYDLWYESLIQNATAGENTFLDAISEPAANALNFLPSLATSATFGLTGLLGETVEAFSSPQKFGKEVSELPVVRDVLDIVDIGKDTANLLFGEGTPEEKQQQSREGAEQRRADEEEIKNQFRDPKGVPADEFTPSKNANLFERAGKNLRALSFYGHANTKAFQQSLAQDADHPILSQVGGAFGSITTSALLATVNPKLAMWAIGGHVGSNFYLDQVARGVDWKPSAGYGALIGTTVSALERMSINLLYKKYASKAALMIDSAFVNAVEETSQSLAQAGIEKSIGSDDRTLTKIFADAAFEGAIGFFGGGIAGMSTVQLAYERLDRKLIQLEVPKETRHIAIMKSLAEGTNILENVLMEGLEVDNVDLDIVRGVTEGTGDVNVDLVKLNQRINDRKRRDGIDTYQDSDPNDLIEEQRRQDAIDDAATTPDVPLTPDDKVELGQITVVEPITEGEALDEVASFLSSLDATSQQIKDEDGNITANVNPGFPDEFRGYKTTEIDAVIKNVKSGKKLTVAQAELKQVMMDFAKKMGLNLEEVVTASAPPEKEKAAPLTPAQQTIQDRETKLLREGRYKQINDELAAIAKEHDALNEDLEKREEAGRPDHAVSKKLGLLNDRMEALLDEAELLPSAQREDLANRIISVQAGKVSILKNRAEVVAARIAKEEVTAKFKTKNADLKAARQELTKYVRDTFKGGLGIPKKFITRINQVTPKTLERFLREVDQARADLVRPHINKLIAKTLKRVTSTVKGGKAVGVLKSAALQHEADEMIRVSKIDSATAQQLIANKQQILENYANAQDGKGSKDIDVDKMALDLEVLQNVAGLDGKNEEELMNSLHYIKGRVKQLKDGSRAVQMIVKEQREKERAKILDEMPPLVQKGEARKFIKSIKNFTVNNLTGMMKRMIGPDVDHVEGVTNAVIQEKIDAVEAAPRRKDAFQFLYIDALKKAANRIYGLKSDKDFAKWEADRYMEGGGHNVRNVTLNNGTVKNLILTKDVVAYWYQVAYDKDGNEKPEMVEKFTGENAKKAAEDEAVTAAEEAAEEGVEAAPLDLSVVKGSAIPIEQWNLMMENFKKDPRNIEFANTQRLLYNTVYSLINPVYRKDRGVSLPRVNDYIPWVRDVGVEGDNFSVLADFADLAETTPKSFSLRTPGATSAFKEIGSMEVYHYFIQEMAHYNAYALPMKDVMSIIRNKEIRQAINQFSDGVEQVGGTFKDGQFYSTLRQMADFVATGGKSINELKVKAWSTVRTNLSVYYLGEPSKAVLQTSSMWMALTEKDVGWQDWAEGFSEIKSDPKAVIDLLEMAPMMKFRYGHEMIEMKEAMDFGNKKNKSFIDKYRRAVVPKSFGFVRQGNRVGAMISGYVVMKKVFKDTGDINEAFRRFDDHLIKTQQSSDPTQLSPFQIGQGNRLMAQFQSAVIQYAKLYGQSINEWKAGRLRLKDLVKTMMVFHVLMPAMRWFLKGIIRGGDFDLKDAAISMAMGPLAVGFVLPDLLLGVIAFLFDVSTYGAETAVAGAANKHLKSMKVLRKEITKYAEGDDPDFFEFADALVEAAGTASSIANPLPIPGVAFDVTQMLINAVEGDTTFMEGVSTAMGESVESLEFKEKKSNNKKKKNREAITGALR